MKAKLLQSFRVPRPTVIGIIVAKDVSQLRQLDRECRWGQEDGVWVLRTTRNSLPRDLDVLRPSEFLFLRHRGPNQR
jgi:hypothetical protein